MDFCVSFCSSKSRVSKRYLSVEKSFVITYECRIHTIIASFLWCRKSRTEWDGDLQNTLIRVNASSSKMFTVNYAVL